MMLMQGQSAPAAPATPRAPSAPVSAQGTGTSEGHAALPPVPRGGGQVIVTRDGDRTIYTTTAMPRDVSLMAHQAKSTAFGLLGLLGLIIILGPFARMWARRLEKRSDMNAVNGGQANAQLLQQQLRELQQSMDAMSVEVERISEAQRFQTRLLSEKQSA